MLIRSLIKETIPLQGFRVDLIEQCCFGISIKIVLVDVTGPVAADVAKLENIEIKGQSDSSDMFRYGAYLFF